MTTVELFDYVKNGGAYCAPLLLFALIWLNADRNRLLAELKSRQEKLENLSDRTVIIMTEFKGLLTGRKDAA